MFHRIAIRRTRLFVLVPALWLLVCPAAFAEDCGNGPDPALVKAIDRALAVPGLEMGLQGVVVLSLRSNSILYERNANHVFLPASNNKLLTSAAAMVALGHSFAFRTSLFRTGVVDPGGTLNGNLILKGDGDPILLPGDLRTMAHDVFQAGIRRVNGKLLYDASIFDDQYYGDSWAWDDMPYYYSAQISGLNVNRNLLDVRVSAGPTPGAPVDVTITPTDKYTLLQSTGVTGKPKSKSTIEIGRILGKNIITVTGSLPIDAAPKDEPYIGVTVERPERYAAFLMLAYLKKTGIDVTGGYGAGSVPSSGATEITCHYSPTLPEILRRMNKPSDNLIAECLLKRVGAKMRGQGTGGAYGTGALAAREIFRKIGLDLTRLHQADGSGLSRENFVSPRNLVTLLAYLRTRSDFQDLYVSLPIVGVDGGLENRMKGTPAVGNCHAKTGYVSFALSLSGYVSTLDGDPLAFSILMNSHLGAIKDARDAQDKIVTLLSEYRRALGGKQ
ncbi:MAG TPA: D-alanyl-D-alanine carboxypeptidase/D-alanyl-D-alanine-endopeptidase, partial [Chthonomonadales bacterium]|nr:D-alanyl-D-alanine carboxypeptidase/D-alanyl-D-alanine-endopeptidase [Chthonomonadales bacterium]